MHEKHYPQLLRTFELAKIAAFKGNHPFGAILVLESGFVLEAENAVIEMNDLTQHAELRLVSQASQRCSVHDLRRAILDLASKKWTPI